VNPPGNQRVPSWVSARREREQAGLVGPAKRAYKKNYGEYTKLPVRQLWKFTLFTFKPAETLVEVIIALFIITIGSGAATSLIVNGMRSNTFSKDLLQVDRLLSQATEMMVNFRDSNLLKYGSDQEKCWNMHPDKPPASACEEALEIKEGQYTLDWNPMTNRHVLTSINDALDLDNDQLKDINNKYLLAYFQMPGLDEQLIVTSDYINNIDPLKNAGPTKFYRMVEVKYPNNSFPRETMEVTVTTQWLFGNKVSTRKTSEIIFKHYQ
jgi:hypothetical protein